MLIGDIEQDLLILVRLVVAVILTGVIGWERETLDKPAGLRTHMLVGLGSALFVVLGEFVVGRFADLGNEGLGDDLRYDPLRLIEAIVTAVSFLGAGTIFVTRGHERVQGLTTAASLWATAAIGFAVGLERYVLAVGSTVLVFVVLRLLRAGAPEQQR